MAGRFTARLMAPALLIVLLATWQILTRFDHPDFVLSPESRHVVDAPVG
jgi:hypothetical protein